MIATGRHGGWTFSSMDPPIARAPCHRSPDEALHDVPTNRRPGGRGREGIDQSGHGLPLRTGSSPARLRAGRPLVVVLHGCRPDAASFANDAGWIAVAQRFRLALLLPEQTYENNKGRCFNWFRPEDVKRESGEVMSIRQMLRHATRLFASDPKQIFVTGFSAGGGMAAALMAAYPAVFAAGGIVAGMPAGCATTQVGTMLHMRHADLFRTRLALANDVRKVTRATSRKAWPRLSIWRGERDRTVDPGNAEALAA